MPYTVTIDGSAVSTRALSGEESGGGVGSCSFELITGGSGTFTEQANVGDVVKVIVGADTIFGGVVEQSAATEITNNPTGTYTIVERVSCVGFSAIAYRRLVNEVWTSETLNTILTDLVTNYLDGEGITATNIPSPGPTVSKAIFSWKSVGDALDSLATDLGYLWWIDANKDLNFVQRTDNAAPQDIDATNRPFISLTRSTNTQRFANSIVLRGGRALTQTLTENLVGDGTRRVFSLAYPVGEKPSSITAAAVSIGSADIGIRGLDEGKKWYWSKGSHELEQADTETVLGSSDSLEVQYKGLYRVIVRGEDAASIATRAAASPGTSGRYERLEVDATIEDLTLASDRTQGLLTRYGAELPTRVLFTTDHAGFRAGQIMAITLPELSISGSYLIDSVRFNERNDNELRYSITALSGETLGGWEAYWRRLAKTPDVDVGDEFITRLLAVTESLGITLSETATEVSGDGRYLTYAANASGQYAIHEYGP